MFYTPEFIIAIIIMAGVLVYYFRPQYRSHKSELLARYKLARSKSLMIQDILSAYILANDALKQFFETDLTYGEFLRQLKKNHTVYLSEKMYIRIKNSRSIIFLKKVGRILDEQEQKLDEFESKVAGLQLQSQVE